MKGFNINVEGKFENNNIIDGEKIIDRLYKMYLSMKAHPDYQTGRNQEFIDQVELTEQVLKDVGKI